MSFIRAVFATLRPRQRRTGKFSGILRCGRACRGGDCFREKFTKDHTAARKLAKEYFQRYPKERYQTEVESWRNLQSSNIEFTMKRLREPKPPSARCAKTAAGFAKPIPVDHGKASTPAPAAPPELLVRAVTRVTLIQH